MRVTCWLRSYAFKAGALIVSAQPLIMYITRPMAMLFCFDFAKIRVMEDNRQRIDTAQIYPEPIGGDIPKGAPHVGAPLAMAELEIMKAEDAKSVANKSPQIRKITLLLAVVLGVTLFSQITIYWVTQSFDDSKTSLMSFITNSNGVLGTALLLVQATAIFALLFTRSVSYAKTIILVAGISFGISLVRGFLSFQIGPAVIAQAATLVVDFLILRKIIGVYLDL